jgi:glutathione S-transferase
VAIRLYRAPFSTNVERVALALAHKGLEAESVVIDYSDRSPVIEVSGQPLVPVIVDGDEVVSDSLKILRHLEDRHPTQPLFPTDPRPRAEIDLFLEWFDAVWKGPPNQIEAELGKEDPDHGRIAALSDRMEAWLDLFEALLSDGRDHLFGDFTAADCAAFPFLKYARSRAPEDDELFHRILDEHQSVEGLPRLAAWIERVDARPRA